MTAPFRPRTSIDPNYYTWGQYCPGDPSIWGRRACGAEAIPGLRVRPGVGAYDMAYAFVTGLIVKAHSPQGIQRAARAAWRLLRYEEPQIAGTAAWDGQFKAILQYKVPKDEEEVELWLDRTLRVETSDGTPVDGKQKNPFAPESATLCIVVPVQDQSTPVAGALLQFFFSIHLLFFDDVGFRCMIASFFQGLVAQLSNTDTVSHSMLDWSKSVDNLRDPYVKLLAPEQHLSGAEFEASRQDHSTAIIKGANNGWLYPKSFHEDAPSKSIRHTFTKEQSKNMIKAVKEKLGPGYTLAHLGQAALLLAMVRTIPRGATVVAPRIWYCPTAINGRRYLQEPYRSYQKLYFPNCQASGFVIFEDTEKYMQDGARQDFKIKEHLLRAAKQSRDGFSKVTDRPHILAISTLIMEDLAKIMSNKAGTSMNVVSMFSSYGIEEQYIPRNFANGNGEKVLSVKDVNIWSNNHAASPSVRLSSWRVMTRISVDWNIACYEEKFIQGLLHNIATFMLVFASPDSVGEPGTGAA